LLEKTVLYNLHNTFLYTNYALQNELAQVGQISNSKYLLISQKYNLRTEVY